jgi:hypothetical protein
MKSKHIITCLAAVVVGVGASACLTSNDEKEETVSMDKVPQVVKDTLKKYAAESDVKKAEEGDEDGTKEFEFDVTQGTRKFEVAITPDGKYLGTEEDMDLAGMPDAVQKTLTSQAAGGKISGGEKAVDANNKVTYEADIQKDGKKFEVAVDANGTLLKTESEDKEKSDKD